MYFQVVLYAHDCSCIYTCTQMYAVKLLFSACKIFMQICQKEPLKLLYVNFMHFTNLALPVHHNTDYNIIIVILTYALKTSLIIRINISHA